MNSFLTKECCEKADERRIYQRNWLRTARLKKFVQNRIMEDMETTTIETFVRDLITSSNFSASDSVDDYQFDGEYLNDYWEKAMDVHDDYGDVLNFLEISQQQQQATDNNDYLSTTEVLFGNSINSIYDACFLITKFIQESNINKTVADNLLKLLSELLPSNNRLPRTMNKIHKVLNKKNYFYHHYYCTRCNNPIDIKINISTCPSCKQATKSHLAEIYNSNPSFLLENVINRNLYKIIEYQNNARLNKELCGTDIVAQNVYQKLLQQNQNLFITCLLHADGAPITKRIKNCKSMWVLQLFIAELPPYLRFSKSNIMLLSIWTGSSKEGFNIFLRDIVKQLEFLNKTGLSINIENVQRIIPIHFQFYTGDLPALETMTNTIQQILFSVLEDGNERSLNDYYSNVEKAEKTATRRAVGGTFGFSVFEPIFPKRILTSIKHDYMHSTLLGQRKKILININLDIRQSNIIDSILFTLALPDLEKA
ncbi:unnamed protein product, partial [Didymodactylos carnosus]